ncbi:hypothetical protein GCM10010425_50440 [Streptomyces spororaveus]|uniref:Uncharacterized protein n=1 Tax=Streptomyces spororaveus TaxID=284039 RepID=A0ABQ3T2N3_9ACTN|nr:hypothetical protein Sspor_01990 [Streptomyces spororaveus]
MDNFEPRAGGCRARSLGGALDEAERSPGFRPHPLLATLYLKVGNGSFGPMDPLLPLSGGPNPDGEEAAVEDYLGRIPAADADTW